MVWVIFYNNSLLSSPCTPSSSVSAVFSLGSRYDESTFLCLPLQRAKIVMLITHCLLLWLRTGPPKRPKTASFLQFPRRSRLQPMINSLTGSDSVISFSVGDVKDFKVMPRSLGHIGTADCPSLVLCRIRSIYWKQCPIQTD